MTNNLSFKTLQDSFGQNPVVLAGKRVLLRLDLNVPIQNGAVTDGFRIKQSLETINFLRTVGAKIIVIAHLENKEHPSLDVVCDYAQQFFSAVFVKDPWGTDETSGVSGTTTLQNLKNGEVVIVENIRNWEGEKKNDPDFAKKLAALADIYVNEAFSVSHREHASIVGVPHLLPSYAGFNFEREVANLSRAFNPPHPYLFILGGAKFDTKAPLIKKFLGLADSVFVGGALSNDLFKTKGYEIGDSIHAEQDFGFAEMLANPKLLIPTDVVVATATEKKVTKKANEILAGEQVWDCGSETIGQLSTVIAQAKFVLWNGPLGMYENGYTESTFSLAKMLADAGATGCETIVGGGDTLASIEDLNLVDKFTFISTAGGAMLDFLATETLPGIEALKNAKS